METTKVISLKELKQPMLMILKLKNNELAHITEEDIIIEATTESGEVVAIQNLKFAINMDKR